MKYLFDGSLLAIRAGAFVKASGNNGEFIYDTEKDVLTVNQMKDIAEINKFKTKGSSSKDVKKSFDSGLSQLKLPEVNKMTDTEKVHGIVKEGHGAGKSEDDILVEIVQSGISFGKAMKMMKNALQELGLAISPKDRAEKAKAIMVENEYTPSNYEEVQKMAEYLQQEVNDTNEKQAVALIRKYCKENEIELPKKPKGEGKVGGFKAKMHDWMVANPTASEKEFTKWVVEDQEKKEALAKRNYPIFALAQKMAEAIAA